MDEKSTSARSASDSLASSDSSSPFASGAASFEFPGSDNDEKLFQDDDESDMWGRGCYRFGVWKNVKVCPRHPTPCLYSGQLCPLAVAVQLLLQPANGDTELHNLAMCKSAQQCRRVHWWWVHAEVVVKRRHVVHVEATRLQLQWPATLFSQALHCSQCGF